MRGENPVPSRVESSPVTCRIQSRHEQSQTQTQTFHPHSLPSSISISVSCNKHPCRSEPTPTSGDDAGRMIVRTSLHCVSTQRDRRQVQTANVCDHNHLRYKCLHSCIGTVTPGGTIDTVDSTDAQMAPSSSSGHSNASSNEVTTLTGSSDTETVELATKQCLEIDPPRFDESTTLFITAYNLIDQQDFRGLESNNVHG